MSGESKQFAPLSDMAPRRDTVVYIAAMCADGPDCGPWLQVGAIQAGIGAALGTGIDALLKGGRVLYRARPQTRSLTISPLVGKNRRGVLVSIRF